jgi:DNA-directed RNA polymerase subunit H (RpoH/RPB5)
MDVRLKEGIYELLNHRANIRGFECKITELPSAKMTFIGEYNGIKTLVCCIQDIKNELLHNVIYLMESEKCNKCIIPYKTISPQSHEIIRSHTVLDILLLSYNSLYFNPTKHEMCYPHSLVSDMTELGNIEKNKLPRILLTDVMVKYSDWNIGDVIKIDRGSEGIYYRVVVKETVKAQAVK